METLLISVADFTLYRDISIHIQAERMESHVLNAQKMGLRQVIGKELYDEFIAEFASGALSAANTALLPYVVAYLCYYTYLEYIPYSNVVDTAFGSRQKRSEFSDAVSDTTLSLLTKNIKGKVSFYEKELTNFLDSVPENYPLWKANTYCKSRPASRGSISAIRSSRAEINDYDTYHYKRYR